MVWHGSIWYCGLGPMGPKDGSVGWCVSSRSLEWCRFNKSSLESGMAWVHMVLRSGSNGSKGCVGPMGL